MAGTGVSWPVLSDCRFARKTRDLEMLARNSFRPAGSGREICWCETCMAVKHSRWVKEQSRLGLEQNLPLLLNHTPSKANLGGWEYGFPFVKKETIVSPQAFPVIAHRIAVTSFLTDGQCIKLSGGIIYWLGTCQLSAVGTSLGVCFKKW